MSKRKPGQTSASPYPTRNRTGDKNSVTVTDLVEDIMGDRETDLANRTEDLEPQSSVTWGLLKEMLTSLKDSINENTNNAIGAVKTEVSQIKTQLEKYNDNLEEVQNRVGQVEERVEQQSENLEEVQNRVSEVEDKVEGIKELRAEIAALKKEQASTKKEREAEACRIRKNNIIINGIAGTSKERKDVRKAFNKFVLEGLELSQEWLDNIEIEEIYRFPSKKTEDPWPLFIKLSKIKYKEDMYRAAPNLKGKGFNMRNDLAPHLLVERNKLQAESRRLKGDPLNLKTKIRDTATKVWMEIRKNDKDEWKPWDGKT